MAFGRRDFIIRSVGAGAALGLSGACSSDDKDNTEASAPPADKIADIRVSREVFPHGVASGDPLKDRVLLWTRVTSDGSGDVDVSWVIAKDPELKDVVNSGTTKAEAARNFTVMVDADELEPGTTYYYAFGVSADARTPTGRTRTLPEEGVEHLRFAFTSCANFNNGYFNAYRAIVNRPDLDVWVHLGDYIYEYADAAFDPENSYGDASLKDRAYDPPNETVTLEDYRARYAQYRLDEDLQELHRQYPIIAVWDDHEVANNTWLGGAENHMSNEGSWTERRKAGIQAFLEWVPVRAVQEEPVPRIYRAFEFGGLFDLFMLDTRMIARSEQVLGGPTGEAEEWDDASRTLIGAAQEEWLLKEFDASRERGSVWRFVGNQVIFSPVKNPIPIIDFFSDFWEGYRAQRKRIIDHIVENGIDNLVFMTGDIHTSWAIDLAADPWDESQYNPETGEGAFGVEFVGPSVTSIALENEPFKDIAPGAILDANKQVKFSDVTQKGYVLLDVTPARVQAEWYFMEIKKPNQPAEELAKIFVCRAGDHHLEAGEDASVAKKEAPAYAPEAAAEKRARLIASRLEPIGSGAEL